MILETISGAVIGAVCFRIRGGWLGDIFNWGVGTARIVAWGIPMALVAGFSSGFDPFWIAPVIGLFSYLGSILPTFNAIDAGRNEGSKLVDFFMNMLRGALMTILPTALLFFMGFPLFFLPLIAGILMAVCYEISWLLVDGNKTPSNYAEVAFGALYGAAIAASLSF